MAYSYNAPHNITASASPDARTAAFARPQVQIPVQRPHLPNGVSTTDQRSFQNVGFTGAPSRPQHVAVQSHFWQQQMTQSRAAFRGSAANLPTMNGSSTNSPHGLAPAPQQQPLVNYQLLLSLAEEYIAAAHDETSVAPLLKEGADLGSYFKLLSTGLGCLDAALRVNSSSLPSIIGSAEVI